MEKLKLRNSQLETENSQLKSELVKMAFFSKRMVEIAAEMDNLLNQRAIEIQRLQQQLSSKTNAGPNQSADVVSNEISNHRTVLQQCNQIVPVTENFEQSPNNYSEYKDDDSAIADFTVALDGISELVPFEEDCKAEQEYQDHWNKKPKGPRKRTRNGKFTYSNYDTDEKGYYQCPYCPKSLKQSSNLRAHVMIHTGEKPWKCKYCNERFRQAGDRGIHMRRAHCDILGTVKCRFCSRYFDPKNLNAHILKSHPTHASKLIAD